MKRSFDLDVDVKSDTDKGRYGTRGMVYNESSEKILPHPSAYYVEDVPTDPLTNNAAFDYQYGNDAGFLKIDLLTNTAYDNFHSKDDVINAVNMEPDWSLLKDEDFVKSLPHLSNHFDVIRKISPTSIEELADVLALIRPGKTHLIDSYIENKDIARKNLYKRSSGDMMYFKRSHAISYAVMIVCCMNQRNNKSLFGW